jgi:hypothetical protein
LSGRIEGGEVRRGNGRTEWFYLTLRVEHEISHDYEIISLVVWGTDFERGKSRR